MGSEFQLAICHIMLAQDKVTRISFQLRTATAISQSPHRSNAVAAKEGIARATQMKRSEVFD